MGLDITAYSKLEPVPDEDVPRTEDGKPDWDKLDGMNLVHAFAYPDFVRSTRGLRNHDVETNDVLSKGEIANSWYRPTDQTQTHRFRAGSYSGHGEFRDMLAKMVGYPSAEAVWTHPTELIGLPFYELIHFADNEGAIGPEAAADLLADFRQFHQKWAETPEVNNYPHEGYYLGLYLDWARACELAADSGLIDFH